MHIILILSILTNIYFYHLPVRPLPNHQIANSYVRIKDRRSLIKYAEPILFERYGREQILNEKPYIISFKKGIWYMDGTLPKGMKGGTFSIAIRARDGKLIHLIHYK